MTNPHSKDLLVNNSLYGSLRTVFDEFPIIYLFTYIHSFFSHVGMGLPVLD